MSSSHKTTKSSKLHALAAYVGGASSRSSDRDSYTPNAEREDVFLLETNGSHRHVVSYVNLKGRRMNVRTTSMTRTAKHRSSRVTFLLQLLRNLEWARAGLSLLLVMEANRMTDTDLSETKPERLNPAEGVDIAAIHTSAVEEIARLGPYTRMTHNALIAELLTALEYV